MRDRVAGDLRRARCSMRLRARPQATRDAAREHPRRRLGADHLEVGRGSDATVARRAGREDARAVPLRLLSALGDGGRRRARPRRERRSGTSSRSRDDRTGSGGGCLPPASRSTRSTAGWSIYRGSRRFEFYVNGEIVRSGRVAVGARGHGDADRPVLRPVEVRPAAVSDPRRVRVRDLRLLEAVRLARRRSRRRPRHELAGLIGQAVSHGCVRLDNRDILFLRGQVPLGTPVKIVAA